MDRLVSKANKCILYYFLQVHPIIIVVHLVRRIIIQIHLIIGHQIIHTNVTVIRIRIQKQTAKPIINIQIEKTPMIIVTLDHLMCL